MQKIDEYFLRQASIFELRNIARDMGVISPTIYKKEDLIEKVLKLLSGEEKPQMPKSRQGRPPKSVFSNKNSEENNFNNYNFKNMVNPSLENASRKIYENSEDAVVEFIDIIRDDKVNKGSYLDDNKDEEDKSWSLLMSPETSFEYGKLEPKEENETKFAYFYKYSENNGFLFDIYKNYDINSVISIKKDLMNTYNLKTGDKIKASVKAKVISSINKINDQNLNYKNYLINGSNVIYGNSLNNERNDFDKLQIDLENDKVLSLTNNDDLFKAKKGSRNIIQFKNFLGCKNIIKNFEKLKKEDYYIINLSLDSLPVDTALYNTDEHFENFYTLLSNNNKHIVITINLALERAKRLAEEGKKVILLVNEAKKIIKHNNYALDNSPEELKYKSLELLYEVLSLARVLKNGGEVTLFLFLKRNDSLTEFERCLIGELENASCNFYDYTNL